MARHLQDNWLDLCMKELDLPGSPWYEVKDRISKYLVERIRQEGLLSEDLAKVRYLLGTEFTTKYKLQDSDVDGKVEVKRPSIKDEKLELLLKDLTLKAAKDAKCVLKEDLTKSPECFKATVALITTIFNLSLEKHINSSRMSSFTDLGQNSAVIAVNSLVEKEIEIIGEAVVKILLKEPIRLPSIMVRLQGRLLPVVLRRLIYRLALVKKQKDLNYPGANVGVGVLAKDAEITQQGLREAFAKGVKEGMGKLHLRSALKCPLYNLIQSSVVETYESAPALKQCSRNMEIQKESAKVLNILYTHSRRYQRSYILWLFPLQVTISQDRYEKEHFYELAMWLNCVIQSCFPTNTGVLNDIILKVWNSIMETKYSSSLEMADIDFSVFFTKIGVKIETKEAAKILDVHLPLPMTNCSNDLRKLFTERNGTSSGSDVSESESDLQKTDSLAMQNHFWVLSHPVLCIRKWLSDLFVGVTDLPVTMFLWDQFFLYNWDARVFEFACLALFRTIFKKLLLAKDSDDLCNRMLTEPLDIQLHEMHRAWHKVLETS